MCFNRVEYFIMRLLFLGSADNYVCMHTCMIYSKDAQSNQNLLCFFKQREQKNFVHTKNYLHTRDNSRIKWVHRRYYKQVLWWSGGVWQVHNEKRRSKPSMISSLLHLLWMLNSLCKVALFDGVQTKPHFRLGVKANVQLKSSIPIGAKLEISPP